MGIKAGLTLGVVLGSVLSGCTLSNGIVKDIHLDTNGKLVQTKCDLKYFSLYTTYVSESNCVDSLVK